MNFRGKHIVVLGAGESGVGAAILAQKECASVFVSDKSAIKPAFEKELIDYNIPYEAEQHTLDKILAADVVIKSPGIPEKVAVVQALRKKNISIVSELEFGAAFSSAKFIAITGSNGKTTTTLLIHHLLKKAGFDVGLAGNVGASLARQVAEKDHEWFVLEISSFQLDDMYDFKADIGLLLNITPDHLDRYDYQMKNYINSKFRIIQNQGKNDWFIYNLDDPIIVEEIKKRKLEMQTATFSIKQTVALGGYSDSKQITINIKDQFSMSIHDLAMKGKHNTQNSLAAGIAGRILEIRKDVVRESLSDFQNVEHRLEYVARVNGIEFINDSKATNINSTWYALESMEKPTVWIVGGVDKGNDYGELIDLVKNKVKAIICLGTENAKIIEAFKGTVSTIVEASSAAEAVAFGYRLATKDETVLLSPACASFDLFENYEDRGNQFKSAVRNL
jgi:UDP-N-acetylmuramoylalanine--D-glutamate ligase